MGTSTIIGEYGAKLSGGEAQRIGIGMASRGEVGVVVAGIGYSAGMIDSYAYAVLMSVIMITTIVSPILLRFSYNDQKIKSTL